MLKFRPTCDHTALFPTISGRYKKRSQYQVYMTECNSFCIFTYICSHTIYYILYTSINILVLYKIIGVYYLCAFYQCGNMGFNIV